MVSFTLFKSATVMALMAALVSAAPAKDGCDGFHITSPNTYFTTTAGQCYQVSYDFPGGVKPSKPASLTIDIYDAKTNKLVDTLLKNVRADSTYTPWFNVNLGSTKKTADYYFLVKYGDKCKPIKTVNFHVIYNKNSPPAQCP